MSALRIQALDVEPSSIAWCHSSLLGRFVEQVCRTSRCALNAIASNDAVTSLLAEASSFMTFTQPQILLCATSRDAARRTSPILARTLTPGTGNFCRRAAQLPIHPAAQATGPLGRR